MTQANPLGQPWRRRLVLGLAAALGLFAVSTRTATPVDAAPAVVVAQAAAPSPAAQPGQPKPDATPGEPKMGAGPGEPKAGASPGEPKMGASPGQSKADANAQAGTAPSAKDAPAATGTTASTGADTEVTIDQRGIGIIKNGKRINVRGFGADREYDSFRDFVNHAPWLAAFVFAIVLTVFLVPVLIVALLVWYKIRKTRMRNETMLKLAEKGVVPPMEAMESLVQPVPGDTSVPRSAAPLYEQARALRKRTAWSDLRKGIVMLAVGLGLSFFSILDDGTPNSVGLVLLFVGLGYCVLWFFEDRSAAPAQRDAGTPPAGSA